MIVCVEGRGSGDERFHAPTAAEPGAPTRTVCGEDAGQMPQMQESWAKRTAQPCPRCFPPHPHVGYVGTQKPHRDSGEEALIYTQDGATNVRIRTYSGDDGALIVHGQDLGEAPEAAFGRGEYEYLVSIDPEYLPTLRAELAKRLHTAGRQPQEGATTIELVQELFGGRSDVISAMRDLCAQASIPAESFSWP